MVTCQNQLTATRAIDTGILQGSILGPLLFVLFINDLLDPVVCCNSLLSADDAILFSAQDLQTIECTLNYDFVHISNWMTQNHLFLNKEKTEVVLFSTSQ